MKTLFYRLLVAKHKELCLFIWGLGMLELMLLYVVGCIIMKFSFHDNWVSSYIEIAFALDAAITSRWFRKKFFPLRQDLKAIAKEREMANVPHDKSYVRGLKLNYRAQRLVLWTEKVFAKHFARIKFLGRVFAFISLIVLLIGCSQEFEKLVPMLIFPFVLNWSVYWLSTNLFEMKVLLLYTRVRIEPVRTL